MTYIIELTKSARKRKKQLKAMNHYHLVAVLLYRVLMNNMLTGYVVE